MSELPHSGRIPELASWAKEIAVAATEGAMTAIEEELLSSVDDDSASRRARLSQDPNHVGAPARRIDAIAEAAVRRGAAAKVAQLRAEHGDRIGQVVFVGEESGVPTRLIEPDTLIVRFDPLDGTTNAVTVLDSFASVASVDLVSDSGRPVRHLAGAIVGGQFDVSWHHWTRYTRDGSAYLRPAGEISVRSARGSTTAWRRLEAHQEERDPNTVASVAGNPERFEEFAPFRARAFDAMGHAFFVAGNPLAAALLLGRIGALVETQNVTLHDSVFLIPHWLLGGKIVTLSGDHYDYMGTYEYNALNFDARYKPVRPYIAYAGDSCMFSGVADSLAAETSRRRRFRINDDDEVSIPRGH